MSRTAVRVTFVVPTYNYARFLPEVLDSIGRQQGAPTEVIVVDDGSTDDPAAIVSSYPGVQLLRQTNRGLAAARNAGLAAATGSHLVFIDADDRLLPEALPTWLALFAERPDSGFVHGSYRSVDGGWHEIWTPEPVSLDEDGFATLLAEGNLIGCPATVMYRKDRLLEVGGFDGSVRGNEDFDVYLRLLRRFPAASSSRIVAEYRYHDNNMSGDSRLMMRTGRLAVERQREAVGDDPRLREAFARGLSGIQRYWIRSQLREFKKALRGQGGASAAVRGSLRLLLEAPTMFIRESGAFSVELLARQFVPKRSAKPAEPQVNDQRARG